MSVFAAGVSSPRLAASHYYTSLGASLVIIITRIDGCYRVPSLQWHRWCSWWHNHFIGVWISLLLMQQLVRSYTMVVDRETSQGVGSMLSLVLTTRWSLRVAAFFLDNHLVLLSVLLLSIGAAAWVVVVFIGATVASNLFLALVGVELRTYQSSATLGYHTTTHSARSIDTVFILVVGTWVTTLSKVCTGVVHHRLLAIVCGKLIFVRHKLVVSPTIARRASVRHRTAICRDSSIYLHGPRLWVALGVAATFIRFFMEGSTECVFVVRPFLFQKRF